MVSCPGFDFIWVRGNVLGNVSRSAVLVEFISTVDAESESE